MSRNQIFLRISWHSTLLRSFLGRLLDGVDRATIDLVVFLLSTLFRDWATHWGSTSYIGSPLIEENFESMPPGLLDFGQKCRRFRDHPPPPPPPPLHSYSPPHPPSSSQPQFHFLLGWNFRSYVSNCFSSEPCLWPLFGLCKWPTLFWLQLNSNALPQNGLNRVWTFGIRSLGKFTEMSFIKDGPSLGFSWKVWIWIRIVQTKLILFHWRSLMVTCLNSTSAKGDETYNIILLLNKCDAKFRKNGCKCGHRAF